MAQLNYPFGEIPPLPFPNTDEGSQETWLGPSQTLNSNQGSFRLFFEPTQPTTQTGAIPSSTTNNTADGNGHGVVGNNPPSTPLVLRRPVPPEIICETPKAIHIDYVVFNRAVATPAPSRSRLSLAAKDWDKLTPTSDIVWKTPIIMWTWSEFQAEVINTLTKDRDHIGNHIITLEKANLLKWKCILVQHRVYGVKSDRTVTSDTEFHPFLEAIRMSPTSKIVIKLVIEDPVVQEKKLEAERAQNQRLAISYGPEDARAALERSAAQTALNPKADLDANARVKKIQEITAHIIGKYGCNAESLRIRDPADRNRSIRIDGTCLTIWSRALMHGADGVDLNRPPQGKEFISEPKRAWTLAERAPAPKQFAPVWRTPSGCWVHPRTFNPPEVPDSDDAMPAPSPLKQKSRRDASPDKDIDPSDNAWDNNDSASNSGSLHQADVLDDVDPLAVGELPNIPGTKPAHKISLRTTKPSGKTTKTSMPCKEGLLGSDSDVECVPPPEPDANIKRSPGRKYRRSQASGVDSALQRLHVNHDEGNQRARSVSPMRKRPGSKQSSAANPFSNDTLSSIASVSGGPESPKAAINTERTLPPLNEMGLALSMADFLRLVGFKDTNTALPVLMSFNHIEHWGFFRRASLGQLRRRGFPLPTAMQLLDGALSLEH